MFLCVVMVCGFFGVELIVNYGVECLSDVFGVVVFIVECE